jgi:hypothetical protein
MPNRHAYWCRRERAVTTTFSQAASKPRRPDIETPYSMQAQRRRSLLEFGESLLFTRALAVAGGKAARACTVQVNPSAAGCSCPLGSWIASRLAHL